MSAFRLSVDHEVKPSEAITSANQLEIEVGEIANGLRKAGKLSIRDIAVLVTYVRQKEGA